MVELQHYWVGLTAFTRVFEQVVVELGLLVLDVASGFLDAGATILAILLLGIPSCATSTSRRKTILTTPILVVLGFGFVFFALLTTLHVSMYYKLETMFSQKKRSRWLLLFSV